MLLNYAAVITRFTDADLNSAALHSEPHPVSLTTPSVPLSEMFTANYTTPQCQVKPNLRDQNRLWIRVQTLINTSVMHE